MTKHEIDEAREALRKEMKAHPNKPYQMEEIGKRFGIPKHFIDWEQSLSYEGSRIYRSRNPKNGRLCWTYMPKR